MIYSVSRVCYMLLTFGTSRPVTVRFSLISVNETDAAVFTVREKEKPYTEDQKDPEVVQPFAAYSPAGHPKVKTTTSSTLFKCPYILQNT